MSLEERNPNLPEDRGWVAVPNSLVAFNRIDQQQWQGLIALPSTTPSKVYRVIIKEYEVFTGSEVDTGQTQERRMVFADALNIPQQ